MQKGINLEIRNNNGETALHTASWLGHDKIAEIILKAGADPNGRDAKEWTPLHFAAAGGNLSCVQLLMKYKANPQAKDIKSRDACLLARYKQHEKERPAGTYNSIIHLLESSDLQDDSKFLASLN